MDRSLVFLAGLLLLALLCGYVRDLGRKAGISPQAVSAFERLALFG
jgi:hypothetical protein